MPTTTTQEKKMMRGKGPKQKYKQRERRARHSARHARHVMLDDLKRASGCADCGARPDDLTWLHFHHVDPESKLFAVSEAANRRVQLPLPALQAEIAKCVLLCANCHPKRHAALRLEQCCQLEEGERVIAVLPAPKRRVRPRIDDRAARRDGGFEPWLAHARRFGPEGVLDAAASELSDPDLQLLADRLAEQGSGPSKSGRKGQQRRAQSVPKSRGTVDSSSAANGGLRCASCGVPMIGPKHKKTCSARCRHRLARANGAPA